MDLRNGDGEPGIVEFQVFVQMPVYAGGRTVKDRETEISSA